MKVLEIIGGVLTAIPKTRNFGLLILGPIIVNILAYSIFLEKSPPQPPVIVICLLAGFLLWTGRKAFLNLIN